MADCSKGGIRPPETHDHRQWTAEYVGSHWRHVANTTEIVHSGATLRIPLNFCFFRPTRVRNLNGKLIGSAVSVQLMAESPYTLQWATLCPKITPSHGDMDPNLTHDSLGQSEPIIETASHRFRCFRTGDRVPCGQAYFAMGRSFPLKIAPSHRGIWTPI